MPYPNKNTLETHTRRGVAVDLFAGVGGLSLGTEQAGFDIAVGVDHRDVNVQSHADNFCYGRHMQADISTLNADDLRGRELRHVDVDVMVSARQSDVTLDETSRPTLLTGGPPCQGISTMGRRNPTDPRNDLIGHFVRIACEMQPRFVCFENVKNLLSPEYGGILDAAIAGLERGGYTVVTPRSLSAVNFGVPQKRERAFIMAYRRGEAAPAYPEATHAINGAGGLLPTPTVLEALADLPLADDYEALLRQDDVIVENWAAPETAFARYCRSLANDPDDLSYRRLRPHGILMNSKRSIHTAESIARFEAAEPGRNERISRRHRLDPNGYSPTLRAGTESARGGFTACVPLHPTRPRTLTVREAARLQSIPDWVRLAAGPWNGLRQVGNSVPPLLGRAVMHEIRKAAGLNPAQPSQVIETPEMENWGRKAA
jgi:DNA (cytosine-5)-methyltransferase 1